MIGNSPQQTTLLRLEERKSFALGVQLRLDNGAPLDLTGCTLSLTAGHNATPYAAASVELGPVAGTITDAANGLARIDVQASQLAFGADSYDYVIVLRAQGYSLVILKGELQLVANVDTTGADVSYAGGEPSLSLIVTVQNQNVLQVQLAGGLPQGIEGGLDATGAAAGDAPVALGDGTWVWQPQISAQQFADQNTSIRDDFAAADTALGGRIDDVQTSVGTLSDDLTQGDTDLGARIDDTNSALTMLSTHVDDSDSALSALISALLPPGTTVMTFTTAVQSGWLLCDGRAVSRTDYAALFAAIGTTAGAGDGSTTFNLPNVKGRMPVGLDSSQTEFNTIGKVGGEKTHLLSVAEMPTHSHTTEINHALVNARTAGSNTYNVDSAGRTNSSETGGSQPHNNLPPYATFNFIIKT